MNSYTPSKKTLILSLTVGGISFLALAGFILIVLSRISEAEIQLQKSKEFSGNTENALIIRKELVDWKEDIKLLDTFFIRPGEEPYFIERVEKLGKSFGLRVETSSVSEESLVKNGPKMLSMSLKYSGKRSLAISFLEKLENLPYALNIGEMKMMVDESDPSLWNGSVKIYAYKLTAN